MSLKKALILAGDGINCENETAIAFLRADMPCDIIHINELCQRPKILLNYHTFALPGGFSYADDIHSGTVMALKLRSSLADDLQVFISKKRTIIGICNGFQVLMKLGLFTDSPNSIGLTKNKSRLFIDKWSTCHVQNNSNSIWLRGIKKLEMPIRHGEGRIVFHTDQIKEIYPQMIKNGQIVLKYQNDENGSHERIAGISDKTGQILGLMPHPEAAIDPHVYHLKDDLATECKYLPPLQIFKNNTQYINSI